MEQKNNKRPKARLIALALSLIFAMLVAACQVDTPSGNSETVTNTGTENQSEGETLDNTETEEATDEETLNEPEPAELKEVIFALDWVPNTNHTGLFLARDLGYYEEEGLDVRIEQSDMAFIEMVASGAAHLGIASQEQVLQARASFANVPVVSVAAVLQHNTSGFASPVEREIKSPKDFEGKTYSGWGTELEMAFISYLMEKEDADPDEVNVITQSATDYIASMETEADFAWIYWGWDGVNAELKDYPIDFILLQDIDPQLDFYSPTIIASEDLIEQDPELISAFLRATKKGYEKAIDDHALAVDTLLKEAPELDRELIIKSQEYLNTQYIADASTWGEMKPERWSDFSDWLASEGILESEIDVEEAYTLDFIP